MTLRRSSQSRPTRPTPSPLVDHLVPASGSLIPLPPRLQRFYGPLRLNHPSNTPLVIANFATTLDGAVAFGGRRGSGGGDITGNSVEDRVTMGILRAVADAVIVGAGTLRTIPRHLWIPSHIYPPLAKEFAELRKRLGLPPHPLNVIVSAQGDLDLDLPVFRSKEIPTLVLTTSRGERSLERRSIPDFTRVLPIDSSRSLTAEGIVNSVRETIGARRILLEGGPHLFGTFLRERRCDELFLTVAPQFAGNSPQSRLVRLVEGVEFGPTDPRWGRLVGLKRAGDLLFLRYQL